MASSSSSHPKPAPHLLFTEDLSIPSSFNLFGLGDRKIYSLIPPTPSVCLGSGHGWLVIADLVSDLSLFNPATGQTLPLPKLSTIHCVTPILESGRLVKYWLHCVSAEVMPMVLPQLLIHRALPIADANGDLTVFLVLQFAARLLAFAKPGDAQWTLVKHHNASGFLDLVSHKDQIFAVMETGHVEGWGPLFPTEPRLVVATRNLMEDYNLPEAKANERTKRITSRDFSLFLATSPSGDLLRVRKEMVREERADRVKVHRLEDGEYSSFANLVEVKSLGENALLLGANSAICVKAADVPGLRRDCVYFAEGSALGDEKRSDVFIYSMATGSVELISIKIPCYPPPAWIMGSFD